MNPIQFRPMRDEDIPTVFAIETASSPDPWTEQIFHDCLHVNYINQVLLHENTVIGFAIISVAANECHIMNIAIAPGYRRCGFGQLLMKCMLLLAKAHQAETVFLEVRASNLAAIKLYQNLGFKPIGRRKGYYALEQEREDAIVLSLSLENLV